MAAFGSAAGGGGAAIQAAMARRGMSPGGPMQTQQTGGAPTFNPGNVPPPVAPSAGPVSVMAQGGAAPAPMAPTPTGPVATAMGLQENPEATMIIKALAGRLQKLP